MSENRNLKVRGVEKSTKGGNIRIAMRYLTILVTITARIVSSYPTEMLELVQKPHALNGIATIRKERYRTCTVLHNRVETTICYE